MTTATIWGTEKVRLRPSCIQALDLWWCLKDLKKIKGRVLDIGCGGGGVTEAIKFYRSDLEVVGSDIDKKVVGWAKKKHQGIKFAVADVHQLPFKKESFSGVVSFHVWEHLKDPKKATAEVYRVLKPGGVFHVLIPLEIQPGTLYWWLGLTGKSLAGHVQEYNARQAVELLEKAGFKIERQDYLNHVFYQLLDLIYYAVWSLTKKRLMHRSLPGLKKVASPVFNLESWLLRWVPAGAVSLKAVK